MARQRRTALTQDDLNTPGGRIRVLRKAKGWSQETLARKAHTSQPAISQWEGNLWTPSLGSQIALAEALGVNRSFLFGSEAVAS